MLTARRHTLLGLFVLVAVLVVIFPAPDLARGQSAARPSALAGPLQPGAMARSGDLVVQQLAAGHTLITLHRSTIEILADLDRGERYRFYIEPQRTASQRVMRIASTYGVTVTETLDVTAPVQLICHRRQTGDPASLDPSPRASLVHHVPRSAGTRHAVRQPNLPTDNEFTTSVHFQRTGKLIGVTLELDGHGIIIDASPRTAGVPDARFAYDFQPEWTGPNGTERAVRIIATPGVEITPYARPSVGSPVTYGRKPAPHITYVQNSARVPAHGQPIDVRAFLPVHGYINTDPRDPRSSLLVSTGRAGVTIRESVTGSAVRIHSREPSAGPWRGARFVYHIVTPARRRDGGHTTHIRILAGPAARVELFEPRIRPSLGADEVDTLGDMNVELVLYRTNDPARIPAQGTPLTDHLLRSIGAPAQPDQRHFAQPTTGQTVALAVADSSLSLIPVIGDAADASEFGRAIWTGRDRYNRPVSTFELGVMGIAAILPFVGPAALRTFTRGARSATAIAARFGRTVDEMEALLVRARMLTPQDRAVIARIEHALRTGGRASATDLRHARQSLAQLDFVIDLGPAHGDIFLFPDITTVLGRTGVHGESAETAAIRTVGRQAAGVVRRPRHHLLPREHRQWFEQRGFVGEHSIDNYTVELEQAKHQAIHGGGNWRLGSTWPGSWNRAVMEELAEHERQLGRQLNRTDVLIRVQRLMKEYDVQGPFVRYNAP